MRKCLVTNVFIIKFLMNYFLSDVKTFNTFNRYILVLAKTTERSTYDGKVGWRPFRDRTVRDREKTVGTKVVENFTAHTKYFSSKPKSDARPQNSPIFKMDLKIVLCETFQWVKNWVQWRWKASREEHDPPPSPPN